ncbi:hypothetical protein PpBr36_03992 [Pyricularia pennisetigena]|uniref:hypothetical protein n=1 Tax=Pyricularia pennisetigena TaxID=1578925 RepID=UPI001153B2C3|nr:hypothetical protein PpBr36_03992 [Pyricularia pennisetigena]TLS26644.1 hypothetical protein PpBr36_03992 [Pyricularia pennisetigena]
MAGHCTLNAYLSISFGVRQQSATSVHSPRQIDWRDVPVVYPFRRTEEGGWMPPYEPDRPENPYRKGFKTTIYLHEPPLNFFDVDEEDTVGPAPEVIDTRDLHLKTLVDACLSSRICKGTTHEDQSHQFEIVGEIAVRDTHGAQIVVCKLDDNPTTYVAKIYDPLYYSFVDQELSFMPRSTTVQADQDYCTEANVYAGVRYTSLAGHEIPAYHGSFTFDIPLDLPEPRGRYMRPVRLIIMEHIQGAKCMDDMDPNSLPESLRLSIMAQVSAARIGLTNCGVRHNDVCERNILIRLPKNTEKGCGDERDDDASLRVVLFDFNVSSYDWLPEKGWGLDDDGEYKNAVLVRPQFWPKNLPRHPARVYWNQMEATYGFWREWWPDSWRKATSIAEWNAWLLEQWTDDRLWKPVWDCLMRAEGPLEPSKEGFFVPEEDEEGESAREEDEETNWPYEPETDDREASEKELYDREAYDQEAYDQEVDGREPYDHEAYDRELYDKEGYNREAEDQEAHEADKDEPEQGRSNPGAQTDADSDAKRTKRKEQEQMPALTPEESSASSENGPDTVPDDSTSNAPEALVKSSKDQHSLSAHEDVVAQDGPSPSLSAESKEHDEPEIMDDNERSR